MTREEVIKEIAKQHKIITKVSLNRDERKKAQKIIKKMRGLL